MPRIGWPRDTIFDTARPRLQPGPDRGSRRIRARRRCRVVALFVRRGVRLDARGNVLRGRPGCRPRVGEHPGRHDSARHGNRPAGDRGARRASSPDACDVPHGAEVVGPRLSICRSEGRREARRGTGPGRGRRGAIRRSRTAPRLGCPGPRRARLVRLLSMRSEIVALDEKQPSPLHTEDGILDQSRDTGWAMAQEIVEVIRAQYDHLNRFGKPKSEDYAPDATFDSRRIVGFGIYRDRDEFVAAWLEYRDT